MKVVTVVWFSKKTLLLCTVIVILLITLPQYIHYHVSMDGGYTQWSRWSVCSVTCGEGVKGRIRNCTQPRPSGYGKPCSVIGSHVHMEKCEYMPCAQHGAWSVWAAWGGCTPNCKDGKQKRERQCNNPPPMHGGRDCGKNNEERVCSYLLPCPINGGLSNWGVWTPCSKTCGNGQKERNRLCNKPEPKYHGKGCSDHLHEAEACKVKDCVVPTTAAPTTKPPTKPPTKPA